MNKNFVIGAVVALIIVGGASFYGGMSYAKSSTPARGSFAGGQFSGTGAAGTGRVGARAGGGFTTGKILSTSKGSVTIQAQNGSTEIVLVSASTPILKSAAGSMSDLAAGTNVVVTGSSNSDGSLTAESIQIRPAGTNNAPMIPAGSAQ